MIEIEYKGKQYEVVSNTIASKLCEIIGHADCIGFYDKENDIIYDLHSQIQGPVNLEIIEKNSERANKIMRASLALILAKVINGQLLDIELLDSGFNCKFYMDETISENDFVDIQAKMLNLIKHGGVIEKNSRSHDESIEYARELNINEKFLHLDFDGPNAWYKFESVQVVSELKFLSDIRDFVGAFKLLKVAQEEYIVNEKKIKVQKITVAAFLTQAKLDDYLARLELLLQNDHRNIGQNMELFYMIPEAAGSVFWLPSGWKLFKSLEAFIRKFSYKDYMEVRTPFVMSSSFWEKSGHMQAYGKNMMHIAMGDHGQESAALKPMNCPGHIEIFKQKIRSYRNLPFRLAEIGSCHRYEPSGALHGLLRVRSFTMDDGHIFCAREQIQMEVEKFMLQALNIYKYFEFNNFSIKISTRPDTFLGQIEDWDYAEKMLELAMQELKLPYEIANGEGAFYGPKIEIHIRDFFDRSWQLGTIQLDFVLPERFDISYIDEVGQKKRPCMLHRATLGSIERFIALLLEHTAGNLPIALAPVQAAICSVVSDCNDYAKTVCDILEKLDMNIVLDTKNDTLGAKIRAHKIAKVPMIIVIGRDEMNDETVTVEYLGGKNVYKLAELEENMKEILKI